jgi:hypothetical protein
MTSFESFKSIDRMSRTRVSGGSTGLPDDSGTCDVTFTHVTTAHGTRRAVTPRLCSIVL